MDDRQKQKIKEKEELEKQVRKLLNYKFRRGKKKSKDKQ